MIIRSFIMALALLPASLSAQTVEVAEGDWRAIPAVKKVRVDYLSQSTMAKIDRLVREGKCKAAGHNDWVDLKVPFLIKFAPDGKAERVVVRRIGCPEVETVMGNIALSMAKSGNYLPTGENRTGWYRSEMSYISN